MVFDQPVAVTIFGEAGVPDGDATRSLRVWMVGEDEWRGAVDLVESPPRPGELGGVVDALQIAVAPGGAAAVAAGAVLSWARLQRADLKITLRRGNGNRVDFGAKGLRGLGPDEVREIVAGLGAAIDDDDSAA